MGSQETRALAERILAEGARTGDLTSAFMAHLDPHVTFHLPNGEVGDIAFYTAFMRESYNAFPDITLALDSSIVDEDRVLLQFTLEGSHQGVYRGFEPTGEHFSIPVCWILQVADDLVVEAWYYAGAYDHLVPAHLRWLARQPSEATP